MAREEMLQRFGEAWSESMQLAVGENPPARSEWRGAGAIRRVLLPFMGVNKNHALLPTGGGHDILDVTRASEDRNYLELKVGRRQIDVVRPDLLQFEYISESPGDSFFLLHLGTLRPSGVYDDVEGSEEVLELDSGRYVRGSFLDQGFLRHDEDGREVPLPKDYRLVTRWFGGKFLFVSKGSLWNGAPSTYDGTHNSMTADQIRSVITRAL